MPLLKKINPLFSDMRLLVIIHFTCNALSFSHKITNYYLQFKFFYLFQIGNDDILSPPTNVRATTLTHDSIDVTWDKLSNVTGYIISYATTALDDSNGSVRVQNGGITHHILSSLKENTLYIITVQSIASDGRNSPSSNEVQVTTHTFGK